MKFLIIAACVIGCAFAGDDSKAEVVRSDFDQSPEGNFNFAYETSNGISGNAQGVVSFVDKDTAALSVQGANAYTGPEGERVETVYVADQNGYQPQGSHLPTPPPVPEAIARSLEYIAAHPYQEQRVKRGALPIGDFIGIP